MTLFLDKALNPSNGWVRSGLGNENAYSASFRNIQVRWHNIVSKINPKIRLCGFEFRTNRISTLYGGHFALKLI